MCKRKEYNDRWNAPLVNPAFTIDEHEENKATSLDKPIPGYWEEIRKRSETTENAAS